MANERRRMGGPRGGQMPVEKAKDYVTHAIEDALDIGKGYGPTNHFFAFHKA